MRIRGGLAPSCAHCPCLLPYLPLPFSRAPHRPPPTTRREQLADFQANQLANPDRVDDSRTHTLAGAHAIAYTGTDACTNASAYASTNASTDASTNAYAYADTGAALYTNTDASTQGCAYASIYANAYTSIDASTNAGAYAGTKAGAYTNPDACADAGTNARAYDGINVNSYTCTDASTTVSLYISTGASKDAITDPGDFAVARRSASHAYAMAYDFPIALAYRRVGGRLGAPTGLLQAACAGTRGEGHVFEPRGRVQQLGRHQRGGVHRDARQRTDLCLGWTARSRWKRQVRKPSQMHVDATVIRQQPQ